ncbi:MAG: hypothetical protein KJO01_10905 [Gammaproteobacteria bacterium]|nr:hypothetical protein [Gammaproteobacteria bacterium]MBT8111715.1 hypothetical protein [Gammaproteobacteria bacterium]NND47601.1 hypothetical protein [Woeseiaceae bacterium]NNL46413.1 hypothetical protein [Woeseiaceae bacterium]
MLRAKWMVFLFVSPLLPAAALADDATVARGDGKPAPIPALSLESLQAQSAYAPRWQLNYPIETVTYTDDWSRPMSNLDFQDSGILGRASKLRSLSFLTLAELGQSRLFLGVNNKGLVGLHLRAVPRPSSGRYLELVRMPYLKNGGPETEAD